MANGLKSLGVVKGDRISNMPILPETVMAMLTCAKIGAIHSLVFPTGYTSALANPEAVDYIPLI
ncbi:hypothetical protein [Candidatus Methanocrinis natronophilus]|uniref:AMP-dependent synthetase/ligase domain-containing protein n=1 Tax=Candidatus Methanocrinis natronophilus TaxID=3033396 RepID=A0ABT5X4M8_9EURY|nr:hypothetical protein [Candidatus Methanocrinis natronophilus]MDF0589642.1 hypothetical protein [Candidatus Methanocrinis natronophilus]